MAQTNVRINKLNGKEDRVIRSILIKVPMDSKGGISAKGWRMILKALNELENNGSKKTI